MSSGLYLYGVMHDIQEMPVVLGLDDSHPVQCIRENSLVAIVSEIDIQYLQTSSTDQLHALVPLMVAHEDRIRLLAQYGELLPAPFGQIFPTEQHVREYLTDSYSKFMEKLVHIRGCVEVGLRVISTEQATQAHKVSAVASPKSYLSQKKAMLDRKTSRQQRVNDWLNLLHENLSNASRSCMLKPVQQSSLVPIQVDGEILLRGIYLVKESQLGGWNAVVLKWEKQVDKSLRVVLDGPFAPYHFVGDSTR